MTAPPTPTPDERRHHLRVIAGIAAGNHQILNEAETARRLGKVQQLKPMIQALRDSNEQLITAARDLALLLGFTRPPVPAPDQMDLDAMYAAPEGTEG